MEKKHSVRILAAAPITREGLQHLAKVYDMTEEEIKNMKAPDFNEIENADSLDGTVKTPKKVDCERLPNSLNSSFPSKDVELLSPAKSRIRAVISDLEGNIVILRRALIDME